jgi:P4 family phage/plasmid primase-like protien
METSMLREVYEKFFEPGEVVEIRAIGPKKSKDPAWEGYVKGIPGIVAGYCSSAEDFERLAKSLEKAGFEGIYFTPNPVQPSLLARANNRLVANLKNTTSDRDVLYLRWLLVDLDPNRPSGVSSTDEELAAAKKLAEKVAKWMEGEMGFPKGHRAMSGNGWHLLYRLPDLENNEENQELVKKCVLALAERFNDSQVSVDGKVFNPARIFKLYGTTARKGDPLQDRPHRRAVLYGDPEAGKPADMESIEILASLAPEASPRPAPPGSQTDHSGNGLGPMDLERYLSDHGIEVIKVKDDGRVKRFILSQCVFDPNHRRGESSICQSDNYPYLTYQCYHDSCRGRKWKEARVLISGDENLGHYCEGYNPRGRRRQPQRELEYSTESSGTTILQTLQVSHSSLLAPQSKDSEVLPPMDMNPDEFYSSNGKGRTTFNPEAMAKYLVFYFGGNLFCTKRQYWFYDDCGVWKAIDEEDLGQIIVFALGSGIKANYIDTTLKVLANMVNKRVDSWKDTSRYINCLSGMLDLEEFKLVPHDASFESRSQLPVNFDWGADMEPWLKHLEDAFPNEPYKIHFLQEYIGYCFTTWTHLETAVFFYGPGGNGKGTILEGLTAVIGEDNVSNLTLSDLNDKFKAIMLVGKLVNLSAETQNNNPTAMELFKTAVSGEPLNVEGKYIPAHKIRPYAKFIVSMNRPPIITDRSEGLSRRLVVIRFLQRFERGKKDVDWKKTIRECKDGIFMWGLEGLERLIQRGDFHIPPELQSETEDFLGQINPFMIFIKEQVVFGEDLKIKPI